MFPLPGLQTQVARIPPSFGSLPSSHSPAFRSTVPDLTSRGRYAMARRQGPRPCVCGFASHAVKTASASARVHDRSRSQANRPPFVCCSVLLVVGHATARPATPSIRRLERRRNERTIEAKNKDARFAISSQSRWLPRAGSHDLASTATRPCWLYCVLSTTQPQHGARTPRQICNRCLRSPRVTRLGFGCFPGSGFSIVCVWTGPRRAPVYSHSLHPTTHD